MKTLLLSTMLAGVLVLGAPAQEIRERRENQQDRIAQGVASGRLTAAEAARLERKEAKLNADIARMRRANGGTLTPRQKRWVDREQDQLSRQINRQKHDRQGR